MVIAWINRLLPGGTGSPIKAMEQATHWWRAHMLPSGLLPFDALSSQHPNLEASAAMVPGLLRWAFNAEAQQLVDGLLKQQDRNGSWQNSPWITGQVLQALMADMQQSLATGRSFRSAVERGFFHGCDWLYEQIQPDGRLPVTIQTWPMDRTPIPEFIGLAALTPLAWAAKIANRGPYRLGVERALRYYLLDHKPGFTTYSPYYAQLVWALDQLGQITIADKLILDLPLTTKGEIPAYATSHSVCAPALLLWSQVYYSLGHTAMGKHLFERALTYQHPQTGAFPEGNSRSRAMPMLGVAWYLQALSTYLQHQRETAGPLLPDTLEVTDPRVDWLAKQLTGHCVLEVQSGKGRYSRALQVASETVAVRQWHVVEPSDRLLQGVKGRVGTWQQLPYADDSFDALFGVDSLSQSVYLPGALREASRVLRSGGQLLLIESGANGSPWRMSMPESGWQDALMQAGLSVQKTERLPDDAIAIVALRV